MRALILISLIVITGCSSSESGTNGANDSGDKDLAVRDSKSGNGEDSKGSGESDDDKSLQMTQKMYPDIKLREWKSLTADAIGRCLPEDEMLKIIGGDGEVKMTQDEFVPGWTYNWKGEKGEKGRVKVELLMSGVSEQQMTIQAGVRQSSAKQGKLEEIDFSKFGVHGFWKGDPKQIHMQICTRHQMLHIKTGSMRGRDFKDMNAKKEAAVKIATRLFEQLSK